MSEGMNTTLTGEREVEESEFHWFKPDSMGLCKVYVKYPSGWEIRCCRMEHEAVHFNGE